MVARIYKPAKNAMQSGHANSREWILEFEPEKARKVEPLMGWTSSSDMKGQVMLSFPSKQEALAYAKKNNIPHRIIEPKARKRIAKSYSDNFKYGRIGTWTH